MPREPLTYALFFDSYNGFVPRLVELPQFDSMTVHEQMDAFKEYFTMHTSSGEFGYLFYLGDLILSIGYLGDVMETSQKVGHPCTERTCSFSDTDHEFEDSIRCSECQESFARPWEPFNYCPKCGAKVVNDA